MPSKQVSPQSQIEIATSPQPQPKSKKEIPLTTPSTISLHHTEKAKTEPNQVHFSDKLIAQSTGALQISQYHQQLASTIDSLIDSENREATFTHGAFFGSNLAPDFEDSTSSEDLKFALAIETLDKALEKHREMLEKELAHFYKEIQPKMAAEKKEIQAEALLKTTQKQEQLDKALNTFTKLTQKLRSKIAQSIASPSTRQDFEGRLNQI